MSATEVLIKSRDASAAGCEGLETWLSQTLEPIGEASLLSHLTIPYTRAYSHMHVHAHACIHIYIYVYIYIYIYVYIYICVCAPAKAEHAYM